MEPPRGPKLCSMPAPLRVVPGLVTVNFSLVTCRSSMIAFLFILTAYLNPNCWPAPGFLWRYKRIPAQPYVLSHLHRANILPAHLQFQVVSQLLSGREFHQLHQSLVILSVG